MVFKLGHEKYGGRQKGGSKAQLDLKAAILGALEAVDGQAYLEAVAKSDPRTFCTLLGRVLPLSLQHGGGVQHTISSSCKRFCKSMTDTAAPSQRAQMASCFTNREWRLYWIVDESGQKGAFQRNEALRALCGTPLVQLSTLVELNCLGCRPQSLQPFFLDGSCYVNR